MRTSRTVLPGRRARTGCERYLVQSQHVEVTDVVLLSVSDPRPALLLVDHLAHVLAHKLTLRRRSGFSAPLARRGPAALNEGPVYLLDVVDAAKPPAPGKRAEDLHLAVLAFGEGLVEAALTRWTNLQVWEIKKGFQREGKAAAGGWRRDSLTCGWHSYSSMRLIHSDSIPHGLSSVALQLQRGISDRSAVKIWTFPIGRFTCKR